MKKLTLNPAVDSEKFEIMYNGFVIGGSIVQTKGLPILRRELQILELLEKISKPCECGKKVLEETQRELIPLPDGDVYHVELSDEQFDLLYNYIGHVPWTTGSSLKKAMRVIDWLRQL